MSEENVELVRQIYEAWGRGDFRAGVELYDPDVLLALRPEFPDSGEYHGVDEVVGYTRGFLAAWQRLTIVGEEFLDAGDSVVVAVRQQGVGRSSGVPTNLRYFMVWTFRGNSVIRIESIMERAQALEAVELAE